MQLEKQFLLEEIFKKYPVISYKIKQRSEERYIRNIRNQILDLRQKHLTEVNKQNSYKHITIDDRREIKNQ